ncbi:hypothetical protein [Chelatococcus sp.]|uniref:hypothetical protein n=1 Tax=Chelatococcus sp. TaxID=1953771 RepID=UPI001ED0FD21|nr:hypothetical protein [Chelatococcus sp.]MBX3543574.1 hypothetical protein [Chelatococcus sp.]
MVMFGVTLGQRRVGGNRRSIIARLPRPQTCGIIALSFIAIAFSAPNARALDRVFDGALDKVMGTLSVRFEPVMSQGSLIGCQIVYETTIRDWTYRKGAPLRVDGSVGFMTGERGDVSKLGATVKVVVNEIDNDTKYQVIFRPSAPSRAYIANEIFESNLDDLVSANRSDAPGGLFAIYQPLKTLQIVMESLDNAELNVFFNQMNGGSDIRLKVALDVERTDDSGAKVRSQKAISAFRACLPRLIRRS